MLAPQPASAGLCISDPGFNRGTAFASDMHAYGTQLSTRMLPALKHGPTAQLIYRALVLPSLRRTFDRVALYDGRGSVGQGLPTLLYANHVSWWDGYLAFLLEQHWQGDFYLMMEEAQLARYRFFQHCGCFGVNRTDAREGLRSVQYAANLLRTGPHRSVWIFPQGSITPNDRRPLRTYNGAAHIAKRAGALRCVPIALRFEFLGEQRPAVFMRLGAAHVIAGGSVREIQAEMDDRLLRVVDTLRDDVVNGNVAPYAPILRGRASINVLWDRLRGK